METELDLTKLESDELEPLTVELTKRLVQLMSIEYGGDTPNELFDYKEFCEVAMPPDNVKKLYDWLDAAIRFSGLKINHASVLWISLLWRSTADVALYIQTLADAAKEHQVAMVDLKFICQTVFPVGFPTRAAMARLTKELVKVPP